MEEFNAWFEAHRLDRFYVDGFFVLDNVEKLERELGLASTSTPSREARTFLPLELPARG
jgi:hypothetical protein